MHSSAFGGLAPLLLSCTRASPFAPPSAVCAASACRKPYRKGLTPCYFAMAQPSSLSGNEQFFYFTSLVSW